MLIPTILLKQLYNRGSLLNVDGGIQFSIKNRLKDSQLVGITRIAIAGKELPVSDIILDFGDNKIKADQISKENPVEFKLRQTFNVFAPFEVLEEGIYQVDIDFKVKPFGNLKFEIEDSIKKIDPNRIKIPRNDLDDYSEEAIKDRQDFLEKATNSKFEHIKKYSFDPHALTGNCEHFTGVAQIPIGIAGPIQINGEHAQGEFLVPLATTEGTLVASYNRGIKVLNKCGGVKCTIVRDSMQRAPVFVFSDARHARDFVDWVKANFKTIKAEAETTSSIANLQYIDPYLASKFAYLRFNYSTGDAAGQNMVGRATFAACGWILDNYPHIKNFYLESNFATDKKASQVNIMRTRGKRVTAEIVLKKDVLVQHMRVEPKQLATHAAISNVGSIMSGANNNGLHSANAITAMFIATGQDVANVSESSAGIMYTELTEEEDLYISLTIPSLIVATYGGGTGLATQKECLDMMDCIGRGKVNKLAEIIAGVVLAGEVSLGSAISSSDWVSSHEKYGRNR
ncbi:UNVERIFIED_CONTAM: hypothetical protein GTU68_032407 [Idotea baltica]|nr:hypothetical protein [Idotea baltica]